MGTTAYKEATTVYLVTQASIPELRNSNRLITQFFSAPVPKLEIVINRFESRVAGRFGGAHHQGADQAGAVEDSQRLCVGAGTCRSAPRRWCLTDSAIARQIRQMVSAVTGKSRDAGQEEEGIQSQLFRMRA